MKLKHLFLLLGVYAGLFFLLFPGFRYIIDPDATGYISVAERLAKGDYTRAINGMWSPLGSWLLAPFIKSGFDAVITAKYLNGLYGSVILCAIFSLVNKLSIPLGIAMGILTAAIFLVLHFVFLRLFGDLLQAIFLLLYLNVVCDRNFYGSYKKIILAAFLGGLGFYAKAYSFYFTLAHLVLIMLLLEKKANNNFFNRAVLKKILVAITTLAVTVLPWAFALKYKYGSLILSRTGPYNMTWSLSQAYVQPRVLFYPPPYPDGYSLWDDPSYWNVTNLTPFTNLKIFFFQLKLIFSNIIDVLKDFNNYSWFFIVIVLTTLLLLYTKAKGFSENINNSVLAAFTMTWPLGILLLHVETRFLWIMAVVVLMLAGILLTYVKTRGYINKKAFLLLACIVIGSFCIYPLAQLKAQMGLGKNIYDMAAVFKKNGIGGNLISNHQNSDERVTCVVLNYLVKGKYFGPHEKDYSDEEVLSGIKEYKIDNYILFYHSSYQKADIINGSIAAKADAVWADLYPGIVVLSFKHDIRK